MGHAGAISAAGETAQEKAAALKAAGATIAPSPSHIGDTVAKVMKVDA
jgi:malate-CoA ligase subunit alpha